MTTLQDHLAVVEARSEFADAPARGGIVEYVVDQLRTGVLQERYAPGQRLIEADLTQDLRVSKGPLREAFRRLSAEGLLEIVPNRGAMIRLSLPKIKSVRIDGAALQERASLGCALCVE